MAKRKLQHFAEVETFPNCCHMPFEVAREDSFHLKGKWNGEFFKNKNPIVLELACGKGEFTVGLAGKFPEKNFIGIDIKGNRLWRGAKTALSEKIHNAGFLRTRIDFIESAFAPSEVSEIWITFPDPQLKKETKRLTSPAFLNRYKKILTVNGIIHLKTDSEELFDYSITVISEQGYNLIESTNNLYEYIFPGKSSQSITDAASIKTYYENIFLKEGKKICYLKFSLQ